jgi:hypothetical protein
MDRLDVLWLMTPETPSIEELLAGIVNRPAWHRQAACRGMGTDAFFPGRGEPLDEAIAVCEGCPVRSECFDAAAAIGNDCHGVWGGLSALGRKVLRRSVA